MISVTRCNSTREPESRSALRCIILTFTVAAILFLSPTAWASDVLSGAWAIDSSFTTQSLTTADVNADDIPDLLSLDSDNDTLQIQLGLGGGEFAGPLAYPFDNHVYDLAVADFNSDGAPDVAVSFSWFSSVAILLGSGDGTFGNPDYYPVSENCYVVVTGDLDGDGDQDLVISDRINDLITVLLGAGDGTFVTGPVLEIVEPGDLALGDFNDDGIPDVVMANRYENRFTIVFGVGDGSFTGSVFWELPEAVFGVTPADFDLDGDLDLATTSNGNYDEGFLAIFHGDGAGGLSMAQNLTGTRYWGSPAVADLSGDSYPDIVLIPTSDQVLHVLTGDGSGTFQMPQACGTVSNPRSSAIADFDGNGWLDVATASRYMPVIALNRGAGGGVLQGARSSFAGSQPVQMVTDDFNGDQIPDLAVVSSSGDSIESLRGMGDGTFELASTVETNDFAYGITAGDLDEDGHPDLAVTTLSQNRLVIHLGQGDGLFGGRTEYNVGLRVNGVKLADVNQDGHLDAALACGSSDGSPGTVVTLLGDGTGDFTIDQTWEIGAYPRDIEVADLNADGLPDLLTTGQLNGQLTALINAGGGAFETGIISSAPGSPYALAVADLDGDGIPDAAVTHIDADQVSVHLGDGSGSFTEVQRHDVDQKPQAIVAALLDDDPLPDLAVVGNDHGKLQVLRGTGAGLLSDTGLYVTGNKPNDLCSADFNQDGRMDLATANGWSSTVNVFLGQAKSSSGTFLAAGPGAGPDNPPLVRVFADGAYTSAFAQWPAYGATGYGVNIATAELDGAPGAELITGAGPGAVYGPHVRGFAPWGTPLPGVSFMAYGTNKYGVNVVGGDIDGDGYDEIVTGAGPGAVFGPHVRGWNWDGQGAVEAIPGLSFFAYGTPKWGVNVCCGDLNGDGKDEIITGAGPGAVYGPHVRGWTVEGGSAIALPQVSFLAYGTNQFGVNVACGDIDGDGFDEIVTGAGPGEIFGPHVRGWNWDGTGATASIPAVSFFAYDGLLWGVNVSCGDIDDDGIDEILTGPGPDPSAEARIRGWNYDGSELTVISGLDFTAFDASVTHGVKVAAGRF